MEVRDVPTVVVAVPTAYVAERLGLALPELEARVLPGVSLERGHHFAESIHNKGQAIVWSGPREPAEHYWEQLEGAGLTMAPLERA